MLLVCSRAASRSRTGLNMVLREALRNISLDDSLSFSLPPQESGLSSQHALRALTVSPLTLVSPCCGDDKTLKSVHLREEWVWERWVVGGKRRVICV